MTLILSYLVNTLHLKWGKKNAILFAAILAEGRPSLVFLHILFVTLQQRVGSFLEKR